MSGAKQIVSVVALLVTGSVAAWFFLLPSAPVLDRDTQAADDCLSPSQLQTHPMFSAENLIAEQLAAGGPAVEVYRGHTREQVLALAEQNDSGAMVVLGAMAMLRANDKGAEHALDYLDASDPSLRNFSFDEVLTEKQKASFQEAHDWFYKAAMHGRLLALGNAGEAMHRVEPNPIKGGWISRDEYDALGRREKGVFNVQGIYNVMMSELAGNPTDGFFSMILSVQRRSPKLDEVAKTHADRFRDDSRKAGIPPLVIPESTMSSQGEIVATICDQ